ncbi:Receptor-like serine/threonine-protein kinase SD1-7, partial [Glycine soja]
LSIMYVHIVSAIMLMCCFFSNLSGVVRIIDRKHFKHKLRKEDIDLSTIVRANRNFAKSNKVGEEFAVKRLSNKSGQGLEELKNNVVLIAKLNQVEANTNRVAGTYGYMPHEYAARGLFSMKSDVFSYGVIVFEIVSGKRNREFSNPKHYLNLLQHRALELLDGVLRERFTLSEVIRCIQVGLLCMQQRLEDRPDASSVVLMLSGEKLLPDSKVPGSYTEGDVTYESNFSPTNRFSTNQISITMLEAK